MSDKIKKIAVLTSGGDAPGMNAGIRAVVRTALNNGISVVGVLRGYNGLIEADFKNMDKNSVSNIVNVGGTILYTARSMDFMESSGREIAYKNCIENNIDAIVVLGGDGSFRGANEFSKLGMNVIGIPATIDLDIPCTDYTIGFDTAINTAMEGVDRIRDTSTSHARCSIIEVMGRHAGYIALYTGISTGAEEILIPEKKEFAAVSSIVTRLKIAMKKGKKHYIIINAEGIGKSFEMAKEIEMATGIETRATVLGYLQRGGSPSCRDRVLASMMGVHAVQSLIDGKKNRLIVFQDGMVKDIDINDGLKMTKGLSETYIDTIFGVESK